MKKEILFIEGMSCMHCVKAVEECVKKLEGVISVEVDLKNKKAEIAYNDNVISIHKIKEEIEEEGYNIVE